MQPPRTRAAGAHSGPLRRFADSIGCLERTLFVLCFGLCPMLGFSASAEELTSPTHRHVAGHFSSIAAPVLTSTAGSPEIGDAALMLGGSIAVEPVGSTLTLVSVLPGFWPLVVGDLGSLDLDGDGEQFFLDADDDGDGLLDEDETDTGRFVSPNNSGSSPVRADSDGDGVGDGIEVAAGFDPNDPQSFPDPPEQVPSFGGGGRLLLTGMLWIVAGSAVGVMRRRLG